MHDLIVSLQGAGVSTMDISVGITSGTIGQLVEHTTSKTVFEDSHYTALSVLDGF